MATESERCVDEILSRNAKIDILLKNLDDNPAHHDSLQTARNLINDTNVYIENNRSLIPSYCLKKITDSLKKLQNHTTKPATIAKFQFAAKPQVKTEERSQDKIVDKSDSDTKTIIPSSLTTNGFHDQEGQELRLVSSSVKAQDVSLTNLSRCKVLVIGLASAVYINNLKDTQVTIFLACGAITVRDCVNCTFELACQQLRIDSSENSKFKIYTSARSMLESSKGLEFSEWVIDEFDMPIDAEKSRLMKLANFDAKRNNWRCIDDFDWLSPNSMSKNYRLVEKDGL